MTYYYQFGLSVAGTAIPDPSSFEYTVADLDVSGDRDSTGELHRDRVATKHNVKIKYDALEYPIVSAILSLISTAEFQFSFILPDTNEQYTGRYYVGDRTMNIINALDAKENWLCDLSFDLIEY